MLNMFHCLLKYYYSGNTIMITSLIGIIEKHFKKQYEMIRLTDGLFNPHHFFMMSANKPIVTC